MFQPLFCVAYEQAWKAPYESEYHDLLFDTIEEIKSDAGTQYSNIASVIQSSGTGKSRMVDEMASLIFTLPFNLRAAQDEHGQQPIAHSCRAYNKLTYLLPSHCRTGVASSR